MRKLLIAAFLTLSSLSVKANSIFITNTTSCTFTYTIRCHDGVNTGCGAINKVFTIIPGYTPINDPSTYGATFQVGMNNTYATSGTATWDEMKGGLASSCFQHTLGNCVSVYSFMCATTACSAGPNLNISWFPFGLDYVVTIY